MSIRTCLTALLALLSLAASAQPDPDSPVRWALDAQLGMGSPTLSRNDMSGPGAFPGAVQSREGMVTRLSAEYYLPGTRFSLKGGYAHERLGLLSGDAETVLDELTVGTRWYPAPWRWPVHPYAGVDGYVHLGTLTDRYTMESSEGYGRSIDIRAPRVSLAPVVGADVYLLSHVALQLEYGFRLGIDSHMTATSAYRGRSGETYVTKSPLHRHAFTIGLKLTFPFRLTADDGETIINSIFDSLFGY